MSDVKEIREKLIARVTELAPYLFPNGRREGNHWLVGSINGEAGDSFDICIEGDKAGLWGDFADSKKHSRNLLDLWMQARNLDFKTALDEARQWLGLPKPESKKTTFATLNEGVALMVRKLKMLAIRRDDYEHADGFVMVRFDGKGKKDFRPFHKNSDGRWLIGDPPGQLPLFHLPKLIAPDLNPSSEPIFIVEGEKCVCRLEEVVSVLATTSAHGSKSPHKTDWSPLAGRLVVILPDNDESGEGYAQKVAAFLMQLSPQPKVKIVKLPELPEKGDIVDWLNARNGKPTEEIKAELLELVNSAQVMREAPVLGAVTDKANDAVTLDDFHAYMPQHCYIFVPARDFWPSSSVNARIPPVPLMRNGKPVLDEAGKQKFISASAWLDQNRPVEMMTWAPGKPMLIKNRLISEGGWIHRDGCTTFNLYRPPKIKLGDPNKAGRWLRHVRRLYGGNAKHIILWLAHRVQRAFEKVNHALFLGGNQGIGKDTLLYPVKYAVGHWNVQEILPPTLLGRFNGFVKSVILCINEAHDLGDLDRFALYERLKAYTAAPPDVIRVDEKNLREYSVLNVCGVVLTSNHKTSGLYLPADDRKDGSGIGEEIAGDGEPIPQVGEVAVDAVAPSVAEGFDLLGLARDVVGFAVLYVAAGGGPLEVAVELDAVGRVEVDALHFTAQPLALG
jgi:hypothetical protein